MILEIKKFNDKILRKKCEQVEEITPKIKELVFNMIETMKKENGIGLAAPQVGVLKRFIVLPFDLTKLDNVSVLINPEIISKSRKKEIGQEGCLSFPGIFLDIKRAKEIEVEFLNIESRKIRLNAQGLLARIIQHEADHLDGILFFNRLSFWKKIKFRIKNPKISISS